MNTAQVLGYPLLLIAALELLLGRLLLTHNPRNSAVNKATAACVFAAALWSLSAALMYIHVSLGRDYLLFARLSWIGWFTVPTAIQSVLFLKDEKSRRARIAGAVLYPFWTAVLALSLFTDLVVTDGFNPLPFRNSPGPLEMPLRLIGGLLVLWLYVEIVRLRRQVTGFRRSQLSYYLYGTVIFGTGGAVVGGFLQLFTGTGLEPSLSAYFGFPWVVMIFYAITRYRLFDIRIVLSRVLYILTLSIVVSGFQFLLFKALGPVLGGVATIFISIPIIGIIFFGTPLGRNVQQWVNELVLRDRLAYQKLLKESANAAVSILHLDELLHFIVERVRESLKVERACLYLRDDRGTFVTRECFRSLKEPHETPTLPERVAELMAAGPRMLVREELEAELHPEDRELAAALAGFGTELLLPLVSKKRVLGILSLGERANGETYLTNDLEVLQALADQAAIAIENAMLFEEAGRMRTSLMEQEELFRTLAQTLPAAIFIHRGGKFLYFNSAGTRMTGYSADEILNMDFWGVVHPDYRELIMARGRSRLAGNEPPQQYEFKILRKDGRERWVLMTAGTIPYEGRTAVIGTIFDITDRKTAEEERERYYQERIAEQERFRAVLAASQEGFWISSPDDRLLYVNDAYCRVTGYSREELQTMRISDLDASMDSRQVEEHTRLIRERGYLLFEAQHRKKGGGTVLLEVSVNYYPAEGLFFSFFRDISDRKRAEEALRRSEERFRQVSETAQEWIWEVDREGRYTYSSPVVATLLGYQPDEVVGKRFFYDFFAPDEREQLKREAFQVFRVKGTFRDFTNRNLHKDGREVVLSTSGTPILDGDGVLLGYRGVDFDISERIRAEQERSRLYEESVDHYQALLDEQHRHQAEKEKILKDLHDGIGGLTTNINLLAELARKDQDLGSVKRSLATIAELSRDSLAEIRGFIQSLDARELTWQAIAAEFRHLGTTLIEPHGIGFSIDVSVPDSGVVPSGTVAMNLFRIYKESLANIVKHAKATDVAVTFTVGPTSMVLEVRDNGVGLRQVRSGGRGLLNMRSRTEELGGTLTMTGKQGTHIVAEIPIP